MNRTFASALTTFALLAAPALAGPGPGNRHGDFRGPGGPGSWQDGEFGERLAERQSERLTRALDLTDAQQTTLSALQRKFGETVRGLFDSMRADRDALEALLDSPSPDPAAVGAKAIALHRSKQAMKAAHDTLDAGIVAMLDDTQRVKYEALQDARPEHGRFERFGRGKGHERRR